MFDILVFLEKHSEIESKNQKEIFLKLCPWCGSPGKHSTNISVARQKKIFHCFRCGKSGTWAYIVAKLAKISYQEAKNLVDDDFDLTPTKKEEPKEKFVLHMPPKLGWTIRSEEYLLGRGLSRETIREFGLYYCRSGFYKERIIIPVVSDGKVITFQARAIDKDVEPRYRMPGNSPKPWFNLDRYKKGMKIIIVEGPFDVMKLYEYGIFAICPMGKNITEEQQKDLTKLHIRDIILLHDRDAASSIGKVWHQLSGHFTVRIVPLLSFDDPAELTKAQAFRTIQTVKSTVAALDHARVQAWRRERRV